MPHYEGYLICTPTGYMKLLKTPTCDGKEIPVPIAFDLPKSLFERPVVKLNAVVEPAKPIVITPEMRIKAQALLEREMGVKCSLTIDGVVLDGIPLAETVRRRYPKLVNSDHCRDCGTGCPAGQICDELADILGLEDPCMQCQGEGVLLHDDRPTEKCPRCKGTGCESEVSSS